VQGELEDRSKETLEIVRTQVIFEFLKSSVSLTNYAFTLRFVDILQKISNLSIRELKNLQTILLKHGLKLLLKLLNHFFLL